MTRVLFLTEGTQTSPASRLRVYEYLDRAGDRLEFRVLSYTSEAYCRRLVAGQSFPWWRRLLEKVYQGCVFASLLIAAGNYDVLFIQRVLPPCWLQRLLHWRCRRLVYDFDDATYLGRAGREERFSLLAGLAARVVAVSGAAAGEAAARGATPEKTVVIPTPVDVGNYETAGPGARENHFTVAWIGSPATTPYLAELWPVLASFAGRNPDTRFLFIGARRFDTGSFGERSEFARWSPEAETGRLCEADAGIMPLPDARWTRGKGGYKLIQYMAAGLACVASPVGANTEIVEDGRTGLFASSPEEWSECLKRLHDDRGLCQAMGRRGRERARDLYDFRATLPLFLSVIEEAADK